MEKILKELQDIGFANMEQIRNKCLEILALANSELGIQKTAGELIDAAMSGKRLVRVDKVENWQDETANKMEVEWADGRFWAYGWGSAYYTNPDYVSVDIVRYPELWRVK